MPAPVVSSIAWFLPRRIHRQMAVGMIAVFALISEPAIGPDLRRTQGQLAGPQDDAEGFVVEYEGQAGHDGFSVVGYRFAKASPLPWWGPWTTLLPTTDYRQPGRGGGGRSSYSDTFARVSA